MEVTFCSPKSFCMTYVQRHCLKSEQMTHFSDLWRYDSALDLSIHSLQRAPRCLPTNWYCSVQTNETVPNGRPPSAQSCHTTLGVTHVSAPSAPPLAPPSAPPLLWGTRAMQSAHILGQKRTGHASRPPPTRGRRRRHRRRRGCRRRRRLGRCHH